jgi:hypothetical protein
MYINLVACLRLFCYCLFLSATVIKYLTSTNFMKWYFIWCYIVLLLFCLCPDLSALFVAENFKFNDSKMINL